MRLVLFLLLAPTFAATLVRGATAGNPVAEGMAVGLMLPVCVVVALVARPRPKPLPRKADPAKIARMERELGMEPSEQPTTVAHPYGTTSDGLEAEVRVENERYLREHGLPFPSCVERCASARREAQRRWPDYFHRPPAPIPGVENIARPVPKPPAERNVEDCPRPEGCVISHPCRTCGAGKGQACVGDSYTAVAPIVRQFLGIR